MLALNVLAKAHLQQGESHVEGLDYIGLACQRMVAPRRFSPWHLCFDGVQAIQHLRLESLERRVEN